jgi:hypothetical protein
MVALVMPSQQCPAHQIPLPPAHPMTSSQTSSNFKSQPSTEQSLRLARALKTRHFKDFSIMATKTTTSFVQTPAVEALVEQYGSQLQQLDPQQKLAMLAVITRAAYFISLHDPDLFVWSIEDEIALEEYDESIDKPLANALIAFDQGTINEALAFCEALLDQLRGVQL